MLTQSHDPSVVASRARRPVSALASRLDAILLSGCALALLTRITVFIRQRGGESFDRVDTAAALQIGIVAVTLLLLTAFAGSLRILWSRLAGSSARAWLTYLGLGALSAVWSLHPAYSMYRAVEVLSQTLALLIVVGAAPGPKEGERRCLGLAWIALALDIIGHYRFTSGFAWGTQSNSFSAIAAMIGAYSLVEALGSSGRRATLLYAGAGLALSILIMGSSLASWWALLTGVLAAVVLGRRGGPLMLVVIVLVMLMLVLDPGVLTTLLLRNKPAEQLGSLHGRTLLWSHFWQLYLEQPLLGYGFAIGARARSIVYTTNTHNAVISVLLGCGAVGFLAAAIMALRAARELLLALRRRVLLSGGVLAAMITALVNSMTLAFIGEGWMPSTFVFICFFALLNLHVRSARTEGQGT